MKKLFIAALIGAASMSVNAQHRHHYYHHHHHHGHNNTVPALIFGTLLGAAVVHSYQAQREPTIIVQQQPLATAYDTVIIDGYMYTRQVMLVNGIYREVLVRR